MERLKQSYKVKAPIDKVWQALTDPKIIEKWGGGPVKMSDHAGAKFSLWGGDIHGTNTKVINNKLLEQDWFSGSKWEKPSKVSFHLKQEDDVTEIELTHTDIPGEDAKDIAQGWKDYYLGPLKNLLEQ